MRRREGNRHERRSRVGGLGRGLFVGTDVAVEGGLGAMRDGKSSHALDEDEVCTEIRKVSDEGLVFRLLELCPVCFCPHKVLHQL